MAENSAISWTHHTWNPWIGCTKVSPACDGCYAEFLMDKRLGKATWGPHGDRVRTGQHTWNDPFRWQRKAETSGIRPFVFCASLADIFDNKVPDQWRVDAFEVMRKTPHLVYLLLTKRPQNIVKLADRAGGLPRNAAIGTSVEDQQRADTNLPALSVAQIELSPIFTFGSFEPLLGHVQIDPRFMPDWIIAGGETDQGTHRARPTHPAWFRSLRDQAAQAGKPFHFKQWGEWGRAKPAHSGTPGKYALATTGEMTGWWPADVHEVDHYPRQIHLFGGATVLQKVGRKASGRLLDGAEHNDFPTIASLDGRQEDGHG